MKSFSEAQARGGRNQDRFVTLAVAITGGLLVSALWRFNQSARGYEFYLIGNFMALFFAPMLVIMFLLGEEPSAFGFGIGESRRARWIALVLFGLLLVLLVPASRIKALQDFYPIFKGFSPFRDSVFTDDIRSLLYGWASYGMYLFFWEFFFRGYLLFGLARTIRWPAVIVQAVPFALLHWHKVPIEFAVSLPAGIILGILALRARSFLPCFAIHWAASVVFDVLVITARPG